MSDAVAAAAVGESRAEVDVAFDADPQLVSAAEPTSNASSAAVAETIRLARLDASLCSLTITPIGSGCRATVRAHAVPVLSSALLNLGAGDYCGVVVADSAIGIGQEVCARRPLDRLSLLVVACASVERDGVARPMSPDRIALRDVLRLAPGKISWSPTARCLALVIPGGRIDAYR